MLVVDKGNEFAIKIEYKSAAQFKADHAAMKQMSGSHYIAETKEYYVPGFMRKEVYELEKTHKAKVIMASALSPEMIGELPPMPELEVELPLNAQLRPYQAQGIARGLQLKQLLIGDEQGLGKTLQSIGIIVGGGAAALPGLVICPASTKVNWQREIEKFSNLKACILDDKTKNTWNVYYQMGMYQMFIVNYESLRKFFVNRMPPKGTEFSSMDIDMNPLTELFKSVIIDEIHRCKDPGTIQSKVCVRLAFGKNYRIGLSGTPVVNKPADLWPQLAIVGKLDALGGKKHFLQRYCEGGKGANNLKELHWKLNMCCFFRREKKDVAKDLPEKQRQTIICDITTRKEYDKAKNDLGNWLKQNGFTDGQINQSLKGEAIVRVNALRKIAARGKLEEVKEFTQEVIDGGQKLILFCHHKEMVEAVLKEFPHAVTVTGSDDMAVRQRSIDAFQTDPKVNLIVCNHKAAGVGITLTASSRVAFIEYPWTYADCVQCEDRAHRIGQKNNVMCTYFLGQNTIDERMFELILEKAKVANVITGATDQMETDITNKVLNLLSL